MGARNELGATLQSTSEGGRQRIGSKVKLEQLCRGPEFGEGTRNGFECLRNGVWRIDSLLEFEES